MSISSDAISVSSFGSGSGSGSGSERSDLDSGLCCSRFFGICSGGSVSVEEDPSRES